MCVFWKFCRTHTRTLHRDPKNRMLYMLYMWGVKSHLNWLYNLNKTKQNTFKVLGFKYIYILSFFNWTIFRTPQTWYFPARTLTTHCVHTRTLCGCAAHSRTNTLVETSKDGNFLILPSLPFRDGSWLQVQNKIFFRIPWGNLEIMNSGEISSSFCEASLVSVCLTLSLHSCLIFF